MDKVEEIKCSLRRKHDEMLARYVAEYIKNFNRLITPGTFEFESHLEEPEIIDSAIEATGFMVEGVPDNLKGRANSRIRDVDDAKSLLDQLQDEVTVDAGNWMDFQNYIQGWHVGHQGAMPSCNGWAIADGCLTLLYTLAEYDAERNPNAGQRIEPRITIGSNKSEVKVKRKEFLPSVRWVWMIGKIGPAKDLWTIVSDSASGSTLIRTTKQLFTREEIASRDQMPYLYCSPFPNQSISGPNCEKRKPNLQEQFTRCSKTVPISFTLFEQTTRTSEGDLQSLITTLTRWLTNIGPFAWEFKKPSCFDQLGDQTDGDLEKTYIDFDSPIACDSQGDIEYHSVAVVGFRTIANAKGEPEVDFLIRNSYGIRWGYFGQAWVRQKDFIANSTRAIVAYTVDREHYTLLNQI